MQAVASWACALSLLMVFYTYAGYPLLVAACGRLFPRPLRKYSVPLRCSIAISAFNEAHSLPGKIHNLMGLQGLDQVDAIWIGSDGSTDGTPEVLEQFRGPLLRVLHFPERRGKPSVLNDLVKRVESDVVIFTDARQELSSGALTALLENFADERVGVVSGELVFRRASPGGREATGVRGYWDYEKWIRRSESRFRSVPGVTGALYAMRRELFRPLDQTTILDDVVVPMRAVRQGYRCAFEGRAIAYDVPSSSFQAESIRKRRTLAGNLQTVLLEPWLLLPFLNPIWWEFFSHKMMRLLVPWALLTLLAGSWYARSVPEFHALLFAQLCFLVCAAAGGLVARFGGSRWRVLGLAWAWLRINGLALLAWGDLLMGRFDSKWQRRAPGGDR